MRDHFFVLGKDGMCQKCGSYRNLHPPEHPGMTIRPNHVFMKKSSLLHNELCDLCDMPSDAHLTVTQVDTRSPIIDHAYVAASIASMSPSWSGDKAVIPCMRCGELRLRHADHTGDVAALEATSALRDCGLTSQQLEALVADTKYDDMTVQRVAAELLDRRKRAELEEATKTEDVKQLTAERDSYRDALAGSVTDIRYRLHIRTVADADVERLLKKDKEYGASWKKRGGVGAYFTMIRKVDRLNAQIPHATHGYDVFAALMETSNNTESLMDTIRDLRGYLTLIEAEVRVRMAEPARLEETSRHVEHRDMMSLGSGFVAWPKDKPPVYRGSGESCDMWTGPCCCGATHKDGV